MTIDLRILLGMALLIVGGFASLLIINANLRAEMATARNESAALHIDNAAFKDAAVRQNQAIAVFQQMAANRKIRTAKAEQAALAAANHYTAAAARLEKANGNGCNAAEKLIDDYLATNK